MKELVCIVCPRGCRLKVDEENGFAVTGNTCPRGAEYGRNEISNPTRVLTSTVRITGALYPRCPVKTDKAVPKGMLRDIMKKLNVVSLTSPVAAGTVVLENVDGNGANVIVTKDL
ncbi:MAG: DUF1667 domain-containing protein [Clostridia bacterium]|nr:DUF1667 domain-containing protein [Clostridia bacterium]